MPTLPVACGIALLIIASVVYELITGVARLRGIAHYQRDNTPQKYWGVILFKCTLAALIGALPLLTR